MKYFVAIALIATVASAAIVKPTQVSGELAEIQEIIAAINSPSTNPATAAALEEMLLDVLGIHPEPISVGPAIVDFPVAPAPVIVAPAPVAPSPVAIVEGPAPVTSSAPLVQIILNINQAAAESSPVFPAAPVVIPEPVQVVDVAPVPVDPVIVTPVLPTPVIVDTPAVPTPVIIGTPVLPSPVDIATPILPSPAITLPEELN